MPVSEHRAPTGTIMGHALKSTLALAATMVALLAWPASSPGLGDGLTVTYKSPAAPPLRLRSLDGDAIDLADLGGRVVVVNFWATWCPPCIEELPSMQRLWERDHADGLEILAVNVGEPAERIRAFLEEFEPTLAFPILLDPEGEAFQSWPIRGLPKTFIVDKRGHIIYEAEGGRDMSSEHIHGRLRTLIEKK